MGNIMNKYFLLFSFAISASLLSTSNAYSFGNDLCSSKDNNYAGSCDGAATEFNMTMKGFRLRKSGTNEFVTITTNQATYNFAAVNAGETVASYLTDGTIPNGTYDAVSPILAPTISVSGSTALNNGSGPACRIATSGSITDGGPVQLKTYSMDTDAGTADGTDAVEGMNRVTDQQYINGDGDFVLVDSNITGFPITVSDGNTISFVMSISVAKSVTYGYNGTNCTSSSPAGVEVSLSATVQ